MNKGQAYLDALEQYVAWFGCSGESSPPGKLTFDNFKTMCAVVTEEVAPDSPLVT